MCRCSVSAPTSSDASPSTRRASPRSVRRRAAEAAFSLAAASALASSWIARTTSPMEVEAFATSPRLAVVRRFGPRGAASPSGLLWASIDEERSEPSVPPSTAITTKFKSSPRHVRLRARSLRGSRRRFELQTAVTTFRMNRPSGEVTSLDLHAMVHFGDSSYFDYYDSRGFEEKYDRVHYELIVDEDLLSADADGNKRLRPRKDGQSVLLPSDSDQRLADSYGLETQVRSINYAKPAWVHADFTRQEMLSRIEKPPAAAGASLGRKDERPLWALASTTPTFPGSEALAAIFRPSTPSLPLSSPVTRRLFSNLFLPGDAFAGLIRALLWTTVPSPELSIMVLDWSSLTPRPTRGISRVAIPVLECFLTGNIAEGRKLVFGQMVSAGQNSDDRSSTESLLVGKRNDRALSALRTSIENGRKKNALLYGGMHCADLQRKLESMGFTPVKTEWRTAFSVDVPRFGTGSVDLTRGRKNRVANGIADQLESFAASSSPAGIALGLVVIPTYLAIGGFDWLATVRDVGSAVENGQMLDGIAEILLYVVRHAALYLGLAKFVVEWEGGTSLFGGEDDGRSVGR